jgi:hypothetical protein
MAGLHWILFGQIGSSSAVVTTGASAQQTACRLRARSVFVRTAPHQTEVAMLLSCHAAEVAMVV